MSRVVDCLMTETRRRQMQSTVRRVKKRTSSIIYIERLHVLLSCG